MHTCSFIINHWWQFSVSHDQQHDKGHTNKLVAPYALKS